LNDRMGSKISTRIPSASTTTIVQSKSTDALFLGIVETIVQSHPPLAATNVAAMDWSTDNARDIFLRPGDEPPLGAHLVTPRTLYSHHGIYVGGGRVIHYSGLAYGLRHGPVEDVSLDLFARGRGIRIRREAARFNSREAVARARSRLGESCYRLLTRGERDLLQDCAPQQGSERRSGSSIERSYRLML
jgi:hypothetical protein